jgi:hypothetical protein
MGNKAFNREMYVNCSSRDEFARLERAMRSRGFKSTLGMDGCVAAYVYPKHKDYAPTARCSGDRAVEGAYAIRELEAGRTVMLLGFGDYPLKLVKGGSIHIGCQIATYAQAREIFAAATRQRRAKRPTRRPPRDANGTPLCFGDAVISSISSTGAIDIADINCSEPYSGLAAIMAKVPARGKSSSKQQHKQL